MCVCACVRLTTSTKAELCVRSMDKIKHTLLYTTTVLSALRRCRLLESTKKTRRLLLQKKFFLIECGGGGSETVSQVFINYYFIFKTPLSIFFYYYYYQCVSLLVKIGLFHEIRLFHQITSHRLLILLKLTRPSPPLPPHRQVPLFCVIFTNNSFLDHV